MIISEMEISVFNSHQSTNKPYFLAKRPIGIYQVYSHYATNNKAFILALVKSPLFA